MFLTVLRKTWRLALVTLIVLVTVMLTSPLWLRAIARGLVCAETVAPSDAMLVENFDPRYLLFEQAAALEAANTARVTFVPVEASSDPKIPNAVSVGIADVMARQARLRSWRPIAITHTEPISLNAALQIRQRLAAEGVKSLIVVVPGFRSRRSALVYQTILGRTGITVHCVPVIGGASPETWTQTWHGIQEVGGELVKLQYYRFYVLPFRAPSAVGG